MSIGTIYECEVMSSLTVTQRGMHITDIGWNNDWETRISNVQGINIFQKSMYYLPKGLDKFLENLIGLSISKSELKEISQDDLKVFTKLKHLWLAENDLEVIEADLLKFNTNLIYVNINDNKINEIDPSAFGGLNNLNYLYLSENICINEYAEGTNGINRMIEKMKNLCEIPETTIMTTTTSTSTEAEDIIADESMGIFTKFGIALGVFGVILTAVVCGLIYSKRN